MRISLKDKDLIKKLSGPVLLIFKKLLLGKSIEMFSNAGIFIENPPTPGIIGYKPIEANTYHAPIVPRSSFPGKPETLLLYCSFKILEIVCEVLFGLLIQLYVQGTWKSGSLPAANQSSSYLASSLVKRVSNLFSANSLPPILFINPFKIVWNHPKIVFIASFTPIMSYIFPYIIWIF